MFKFHVGYVGGSWFDHTGSAVEPLCLPRDPEWGIYRDGIDGAKASVYGAEYETNALPGYMSAVHDNDVPCAVCLVRNRSVVQMIPGMCIRWIMRDVITKVKLSPNSIGTNVIFRNKSGRLVFGTIKKEDAF